MSSLATGCDAPRKAYSPSSKTAHFIVRFILNRVANQPLSQHHSSPFECSFTPFATSFIPFRVPIHPFHTMKRALLAARKEQLLACERRFLAMRKAFPPKSLRCDGGPRKSLGDAVCLSFVFWLMVTHNATNKKGVKPNLSKVPPQFSSHWQDAVRMSCLALP